MTSTHRIQSIITRIAIRHALDLSAVESHLRLEQRGYIPLVIEKIGKNLLSVAHYYTQNGDAIADPDVVFFIGADRWIPYEVTQSLGGCMRVAELSADGATITKIDSRAMASLVAFCETWAHNLEAQNWLEAGTIPGANTGDAAQAIQSPSSLV